MKLPENVSAQLASVVNACAPDLTAAAARDDGRGATSLLPLALEILEREYGSFVLFGLSDHDDGDGLPNASRTYEIVAQGIATPLDEKLREVVGEWLEKGIGS